MFFEYGEGEIFRYVLMSCFHTNISEYSSPSKKAKYYKKDKTSTKRPGSVVVGDLHQGSVHRYVYKTSMIRFMME